MSAPPISLLLISYSYPPVLGGSEMEAQRVCGELVRRGYRVKVLCAGLPAMPDAAEFADPGGVPVRVIGRGYAPPRLDWVFALGVAWSLWRLRREYRLVYFLMQGLHLATGLPVARLLRKPMVMKFSGSSLITAMRQSFLGRLELRWLRKWVPQVMVLNPGMADEAVAAGLRSERLRWMPNPVDTSEFSPCQPGERIEMRARLGVPAAAQVALFVGRLAPEKELGSLLGGFAAAARKFPEALLVLVGDGPERERLQALAAALDLGPRVRFTGRLAIPEVRQWLRASDAFALVSSNEGFPCSLAEAMSAGLPSVVSAIPANLQLIDDGVHGLHAALKDEASIADGLARLFGDPALGARMGEAARRRVIENYSTGKVIERYEALFAEALGAG
jgi:glycosyltransferase involved in cell wall biosynthesis